MLAKPTARDQLRSRSTRTEPNPNPNPVPGPNPNPHPSEFLPIPIRPAPDPGPAPDPNPGPVGTESCEDVFWCANDCDEDPDCIDRCRDRGSFQAQQEFDPLISCLLNAPCADDDYACFENACSAQFAICVPSQFGHNGGQSQGGSCAEIWNCVKSCPAGDTSCADRCTAQGSDFAREIFSYINQCAQIAGCTDISFVES